MKIITSLLVLFVLLIATGCRHEVSHHQGETKITSLDIDEVNKLSPYMVDLKTVGDLESHIDTIRSGDSIIAMQQRTMQSFSFRVMVDDDGHPVMPDSTSTVQKRGSGGWNNGSVTVWCMGGCMMVNSQLCLMKGCTPMENACGCIPPVCGACTNWGCTPMVTGFISGGLVLR